MISYNKESRTETATDQLPELPNDVFKNPESFVLHSAILNVLAQLSP